MLTLNRQYVTQHVLTAGNWVRLSAVNQEPRKK